MNQQKLKDKYLNQSAATSFSSILQNRFVTSRMADIDGDGCDEVIMTEWNHSYNEAPKLGILSYFNYGALADEWKIAKVPEQLIVTAQQNIKGSEQFRFAKLRTKEVNDIVVFNSNIPELKVWGYPNIDDAERINPILALQNLYSNFIAQTNFGILHIKKAVVKGQTSAPVQPDWELWAANSFYIGDVDNDGLDEILVLNNFIAGDTATQTKLGLFKWVNGALAVMWTSTNETVPAMPGQPAWNIFAGNKFYIGDVDGDGKNEIVAFDGNAYLGIFKWDAQKQMLLSCWQINGKVPSASKNAGAWTISKNNWFRLADVNGDKRQELIAFNGAQLGVLRFDGSNMNVIGINAGSIPGKEGKKWTIRFDQIHFAGNFIIAGTDTLLVSTAPLTSRRDAALLQWNNSLEGFEALAIFDRQAPLLNSNDCNYTVADVDGDGLVELVAQSDHERKIGYLKWVNGQFAELWSAKADANGKSDLQSWGVNIIANAPKTTFDNYWTDKNKPASYPEIYRKASDSLIGTRYDLETWQYTNVDNGIIGTYIDKLDRVKNGEDASWSWVKDSTKYTKSEIDAVFDRLMEEMKGVQNSREFRKNMEDLQNAFRDQRKTDYKHVKKMIAFAPADLTKIDWGGFVSRSLLMGFQNIMQTATPELAVAYQFARSVVDFSQQAVEDRSDSSINYTIADQIDSIENTIDTDATIAIGAMDALQNIIIQDPVKLVFYGKMLLGSWASNIIGSNKTMLAAQTSNQNRLSFYRILLKLIFSIIKTLKLNTKLLFSEENIPQQAILTEIKENYCLTYTMSGTLNTDDTGGFPKEELIKELEALNIDKYTLLKGEGDFNIEVINSEDYTNSKVFFTTNKTDKKVYIKIFDIGGEGHSLDRGSGWLNPGESKVWEKSYALGSYYKIKAEVKSDNIGNNPTIYNTTIQVKLQDSGRNPCKNAIRLLKGNNNYYWEKV